MAMKIIIKCRLCLEEFDEEEMFDLFTPEDQADGPCLKLNERVEYCCGVRVRESLEMPSKICFKCFDMTRIWFKFRQMCINSQAYLESNCTDRVKPDRIELKDDSDYLEYLIEDLQTFRSELRRTHTSFTLNLNTSDKQNVLAEEDEYEDDVDKFIESVPAHIADSDSEFEEIMQKIKKEEADVEIDDTIEMVEEEGITDDTERQEDNNDNQLEYVIHDVYEENEVNDADDAEDDSDENRLKIVCETESPEKKKKKKYYVSKKQFRPASPTSYMCSICGNVYNKKASFNYHMSLHTERKPHQCELCNRTFRQVCELKNHMRRHTGERPFKCTYCDRHFIDRSEKHRHERIHTNDRPYVCNVCGKSFTYSAILKNHKKVHSGEKDYKCSVCEKSFTLQHQLKAHLQTLTHKQKEEIYIASGYDVVYE